MHSCALFFYNCFAMSPCHYIVCLCCTFYVLHSFHVLLFPMYTFSCCTLFMLNFFYTTLFSCWNFFALHSFYVALFLFFVLHSFCVALPSCFSFSVLRTFHAVLFSYWSLSMLHFLDVALSPCYTTFMIHCYVWIFSEKVCRKKTLEGLLLLQRQCIFFWIFLHIFSVKTI